MLTVDANVWVAAYDPHDRFHEPSIAFLAEATARRMALDGPAIVLVEVACAVARRTGRPDDGAVARAALNDHPSLRLRPVDAGLLDAAVEFGLSWRLRGADALYPATAATSGSTLVSWDRTLIEREGAVDPQAWLSAVADGEA